MSLNHVRLFYDPTDYSLPVSFVHGISQARIQDWVATSFSGVSSQPASPELTADPFTTEPPGKPNTKGALIYFEKIVP